MKEEISGNGAVRAGKRFTFFISNEDMNDIIKIIISLEDSCVLICGITQTVKSEMKNQECWFLYALLAPLVTPVVQPAISLVMKGITGKGVTRVGRGYIDNNF